MSEPLTGIAPESALRVRAEPAAPPLATTALDQVELIAAVVRSVPGVADLSGGRFGEYTTYLPGRRVAGVVERDGRLAVAVTARTGHLLIPLGERIRDAVAGLDDRVVDVMIADLDTTL